MPYPMHTDDDDCACQACTNPPAFVVPHPTSKAPAVDVALVPITVPPDHETMIVHLDAGHTYRADQHLKAGWFPVATWLDVGVLEVEHRRPGADRYSSSSKDVSVTKHLAPVRSLLLARGVATGIGEAHAAKEKAEAAKGAAELEVHKLKASTKALEEKQAKLEEELRLAYVELHAVRPKADKLERHVGALREHVGRATFDSITAQADADATPAF